MNVLLETRKTTKKKVAVEGGAQQSKKEVSNKPLVALGGLLASTRAPVPHLSKAPTVVDDDEVEIILVLILIVPISFLALAPLVAAIRRHDPSI